MSLIQYIRNRSQLTMDRLRNTDWNNHEYVVCGAGAELQEDGVQELRGDGNLRVEQDLHVCTRQPWAQVSPYSVLSAMEVGSAEWDCSMYCFVYTLLYTNLPWIWRYDF